MGADIFESYVGSIIATVAIAAAAGAGLMSTLAGTPVEVGSDLFKLTQANAMLLSSHGNFASH
jgi:K(+)-stimulated pyrophosphate-energized sodium pump